MGKTNNHKVHSVKKLNKYKSSSVNVFQVAQNDIAPQSGFIGKNLPNINTRFSSKGKSKGKGMKSLKGGTGSTGFTRSAPGQGQGQGHGGGSGE